MRTVTGIELGPRSAVLARVKRSGRGAEVLEARAVGPDEWPTRDDDLVGLLQQIRADCRLPAASHVALWDAPALPSPQDAATRSVLRPLLLAGFDVVTVRTVPEALADLAGVRSTPADPAAAWVAVGWSGGAVAVVHEGEVLLERTLTWIYRREPGRDELFRYTLLSQLAPELQQAIELVREGTGVDVRQVFLCGELPDLRSLTMPLIEELDLEVEALDSPDDLQARPGAGAAAVEEHAAALRLAVAVASHPAHAAGRRSPVIAAAAVLVMLAAGAALWRWSGHLGFPAATLHPTESPQDPRIPEGPRPSPTTGPVDALPRVGEAGPDPGVAPLAPPGPAGPGPAPAAEPVPRRPPPEAVSPAGRPARARDPLPVVDGVMIAGDRRLAIVDGEIVREGDRVGPREIVRIERDGVLLREPAGTEVRVPVGRR